MSTPDRSIPAEFGLAPGRTPTFGIAHIVNPDRRLRTALAALVEQCRYHVEQYSSVDELRSFAPSSGVVLIDDAASARGRTALDCIFDARLDLPVIVTTREPTIRWAVAAIRSGATECLALPVAVEELSRLLRAAAARTERTSQRRREVFEARVRLKGLTPRERQVLENLCRGMSNKQIGMFLGISYRTVEIHRAKMMDKLGVSNSAQAVRWWLLARMDWDSPL